ncbi:MAG TPA: hypothetical protein VHR65_03590 [Solirubrobacterales bacterium]|nr:hypothetical protein [Solirubrobacterales bacterium]
MSDRAGLGLVLGIAMLSALVPAPEALAAPPAHLRVPALDIAGLNHACGAAVDSKGDVYVSSAGESKVKIFNPSHTELGAISNTHEPCGLAVDTKGNLYVSEKAAGEVVRYHPTAYPFAGSPSYETPVTIDASGNAKGIAVDPTDDRLYVAEGNHVAIYKSSGSFEANTGEPALTEASGVAAYTSATGDRHLFVADAKGIAADELLIFSAPTIAGLKLRREINGSATPDGSFGFGPAGAYLAVDPGNRTPEGKCSGVAEQACTAGHLFLYDAVHKALDEFDATGEYLDRTASAAFADAEPTAVAIDRSGGPNDGTIYVTAGAGSGAEALAFGPLAAPSRATLGEPLSHLLAGAQAVATDSHGNVYAAAGSFIHVYQPNGTELLRTVGEQEVALIEDSNNPKDIAVDSSGKVYVLDERNGFPGEPKVTYYAPSAYPPVAGTTYARHEPGLVTEADFPAGKKFMTAIAVNPGPGQGKDHLFVVSNGVVREYNSAANGSGLLNGEFAGGLIGGIHESIAIDGASGAVYVAGNPHLITVVNAGGTEVLARIEGQGAPKGSFGFDPHVAVDQSNGHVVEYDAATSGAREYDAAGAFVAEFGDFTTVVRPYRVAIDGACAIHEPPLTESTSPTCHEYDPANGTAYVAYDDPNLTHPPYDVSAFGPLAYGEVPAAITGVAGGIDAGSATLNGTVDPNGFDLEECRFEYLTDAAYEDNIEHGHPVFEGAVSKGCAESNATIGHGTEPVPVHADVTSGISPQTTLYRFRLVAKNKYGESEGHAGLFGPPQLEAEASLPILYAEATLRVKVKPSGLATKYRFDYVDRESFEEQGGFEGPATRHTTWAELAPGEAAVPVSAAITGLAEGTEYRYRAVAENEAAAAEEPTQAFVTQARRAAEECPNVTYRFGLSANLADCRAYELVTPGQTDALSPFAANGGASSGSGGSFSNWLTLQRGEGAGDDLAYFTEGTLPGFEGNGRLDGYRAERGAGEHPSGGWQSALFSPGYAESAPGIHSFALQHGVAPDQLYSIWESNPEPEAFPETLPHGVYLRTPAGFEVLGRGSRGEDLGAVSRYLSAGGAHAIFASSAHLEPAAPPAPTQAVYDRAAGAASATVISTPPAGASPALEAEFESHDATYVAASEDGATVVFTVGGALYMHREGATVEIAAAPNTFAGLAADGGHVFYVAAGSSGNSPAPIFACDAEVGPCAGPGAHSPEEIAAAGIFAAVSPDGTRAFFSSAEDLSGGEVNENGEGAEAGAHNLYAWDGTGVRFVGRLSAGDFELKGFAGIAGMNLAAWTRAITPGNQSGRAYAPTRSTPDGVAFVFQSHARLTEYENEGVGEIYRYDPAAEEGERLLCVSCDPSGAPPSADALLEDIRSGIDSPVNESTMIANLTDSGKKIFFQSFDRLLPEDANEAEDVYEWVANGAGGCIRSGGCLALISSGQGETPSYLYGMSAEGNDVFFATKEKLVGADVAGSPSIYDARVGGGIPDPAAPAPCQGDACQGQGSEPPTLPSPASIGAGEGNEEPKAQPCRKGKHRVKGRCVKRHAKTHHRRAKHNRRARR